MIDFSKVKVSKQVNKKEKVSSSIRKTNEVEKVRPKIEMKNFNISMYKQVFQFCDKCDVTTVHTVKQESVNCIYCNKSYNISYHNQYKTTPLIYVPQIQSLFLL